MLTEGIGGTRPHSGTNFSEHWDVTGLTFCVAIRYGVSLDRSRTQLRCPHDFLCPGAFLSRVVAALRLPRHGASKRNDGLAVAAPRLWHHLDRLALFLQFGTDAGDEKS